MYANASDDDDNDCDLSHQDLVALTAVRASVAGLCCLLCMAVLVAFCWLVKRQGQNCVRDCWTVCKESYSKCRESFEHRLVIYLTVVTLFYLLMFVAQLGALSGSRSVACTVIGFFNQLLSWFYLLVMLWVMACFSYNYYHGTPEPARPLDKIHTFWREVLPILFTTVWSVNSAVIPIVSDSYGLTGGWCWIREEDENCDRYGDGIAYQWTLWYSWVTLSLIAIVSLLIAGSCTALKRWRDNQKRADPALGASIRLYQKTHGFAFCYLLLTYFPVYSILTGLELTARILSYLRYEVHHIFALWVIHAIVTPVVAVLLLVAILWYLRYVGGFETQYNRIN